MEEEVLNSNILVLNFSFNFNSGNSRQSPLGKNLLGTARSPGNFSRMNEVRGGRR